MNTPFGLESYQHNHITLNDKNKSILMKHLIKKVESNPLESSLFITTFDFLIDEKEVTKEYYYDNKDEMKEDFMLLISTLLPSNVRKIEGEERLRGNNE